MSRVRSEPGSWWLGGVAASAVITLSALVGCSADDEPAASTDESDDSAESTEGMEPGDDDDDDDDQQRRDAAARDAGGRDAGGGSNGDGTTARRDSGAQQARDAGATATNDAAMAPSDAGVTMPPPPSDGSVCARWNADRMDLAEGPWSGNVEMCQAGDMTPAARANALRLVNLYRALVGLPAVTMNEDSNRLAQACALMMRANGTITHTPPMSWKCYTADGAKAAMGSSVSSGPAVSSVDLYMVDPGNPTTIGHRRWIISNWLTTVGFGGADRFSCQHQPARQMAGGKPWIAWPSPGEFPLQAFAPRRFGGTLDQTGWTVQSDSINLAAAQVTVSSGGMERPVTVTQLMPGYGSRYALRFNPSGWTTKAGETYSVKIAGLSMPIEYEVKVVDCGTPTM